MSIDQTIESLLAQNYENFEVIVIDDGSSDRTTAISRTYESTMLKAEALNTGIGPGG